MDQVISTAALRAVLRFSLTATSTSSSLDFDSSFNTSAAGGPPIDESDPRIRQLLEQIRFSRRFILTYYPVLASGLFIFTVVHQTKQWRRGRRRRRINSRDGGGHTYLDSEGREDRHTKSGGSSSNSTLKGTASPPDGKPKPSSILDEQSPLLFNSTDAKPPNSSLWSKAKGLLMYQPPDILSWNVRFPSHASSLLILAFVGLNAFYLFYHVPLTIPMLFAFADRAGLVFIANLPMLYLLSAKNQPLKWLVGVSYESLNIFHRRLGEIMITLALIHTLGMFGIWYTLLSRIGFSLSRFLASPVIFLGIFSYIAYQTIYYTSTAFFRHQWYEVFLSLHIILQVAALVLVWFHHHNTRIYVGVALAIWVIDRFIIRMTLKTKVIKASLRVMEDEKTVQISSDKVVEEERGLFSKILKPDLSGGWNATDHVFLTVPSLSRMHIIQAHPFTIASRASQDPKSCLRLLIRAQDGFSKDLLSYAKGHDSVLIRADGPYGAQSPVKFLQVSDFAIVVAGGSGIAVAMPLVWSLMKGLDDPETAADVKTIPRKVLFVWIFHDKRHLSWIDPQDLDGLAARGVEVMPCLGRRDIDEIMQSWIQKEIRSMQTKAPRIGVVVSGPDSMNREVRNSCAAMASSGHNISVEVEKYGW